MKSRSLATRFADFYCQQLNWQTYSWEMTRRNSQTLGPWRVHCNTDLSPPGEAAYRLGPKRHEAEKRRSLHALSTDSNLGWQRCLPLLVLPLQFSRRNRSPHPCKESECLKCLGQNEQRSFSTYNYAFRILSHQRNALPIHCGWVMRYVDVRGPPQLSLTHSLGTQGAEELTDLFQCTTVVLLSPLSALRPPPPA